jgi:hypothetical protein
MAAQTNVSDLFAEVALGPGATAEVSALSAEVGYRLSYADAEVSALSAEIAAQVGGTAQVSALFAEIGWEAVNTAVARVTHLFAEIARSTALPGVVDLTAISPDYATTTGGVDITLTGIGFEPGMYVTIGGSAVTSLTYVNSTTLTGVAPPHAAGVCNVTARWPDGETHTLTGAFTYFVLPPYQCLDRFPAQEPLA